MTATLFPGAETPARGNDLTQAERDALILSCERQCRRLARDAAQQFGRRNEAEDLEQDAMVACLEAARAWNPAKGTKFITFATAFVRRTLFRRIVGELASQGLPPAHLESWESVADPADAGGDEPEQPGDEDERLLRCVAEPARTAVRLVVFEGLAPDRAAVQLGVSVKDLKLMLRNAADVLAAAKAKLALPALPFGDGGADGECD